MERALEHAARSGSLDGSTAPHVSESGSGRPLDLDHDYPLRGLAGALPGRPSDNDRYLCAIVV